MEVPGPSVSAAADDESTRKSSRLKDKPRLDVVKLMSEHIPMPKVTPEDRRRLADGKEARQLLTRPTASIVVGTDGKKREITVYPCRVCDFLGRTPQVAKNHEYKAHPKKRRCKVCLNYLHCQADLETHCLEEHQSTPSAVKCASCDFIALNQTALDAHTEYEHYAGAKRNEYCRETTVDGRQCTARFVQIKELRKHLASEHGLVAAMDTIQEEFATWEGFMRWKAQFELETRSVYKIGYGRRHGNRRYMCVRSGRYKPVPDETRQRRPRENRTIKIGFNCTATMICKFPDTGGVRVVVHPFHYGHNAGDMRLSGMKPEGAPDDWIRPDTRKKKPRKSVKAEPIDVITVKMEEPSDGDITSFPVLTVHFDKECQLADSDPLSSQESAAAVAAITASTASDALPPEGYDIPVQGHAMAIESAGGGGGDCGDGIKSGDEPGTGGGSVDGGGDGGSGGDGDGGDGGGAGDGGDGGGGDGGDVDVSMQPTAATGDAEGNPVTKPVPVPDSFRLKTLRRRPGPKSKCGPPPSPSPPPEPEPEPEPELEPEPRRGLFGRPLPLLRPGPGCRYKKLLRRAKTMKGLRRQLGVQLARLGEAREQHAKHKPSGAVGGAPGGVRGPGGSVSSCLVGTPLEDVSEIDETPPPLAVLRAEPGDIDTLPDGVFPEMDLLTAPTDLQAATDTVFDLKLEVLSLRARLVRRAAVETALRADALEASARHEAAERRFRAELEQTRVGQGSEAQRLRRLLESVFSSAQVMALEDPPTTVPWAAEDYEQAIGLRWVCSQQAFDFVRHNLKVPLPSMAAVRAVAGNGRMRHVADNYLELLRAKALEGDTVDEDQEGQVEVRMVFDGPGQTVEVTAEPTHPGLPEPIAVLDQSAASVLYRRRRQREARLTAAQDTAAELTPGTVRNIRLRTADGLEESVAVTLQMTGESGQVWQRRTGNEDDQQDGMEEGDDKPTVVIGHFEGDAEETGQFIALDVVDSPDGEELTIATTSPSKRARY